MTTVNCSECGKQLRSKAKACTACGAPARKKTSVLAWITAAAFGVIVFFAALESDPSAGGAPNTADTATGVCAALKAAGAASCKPEFNSTEPSYINATMRVSSSAAQSMCEATAKGMHKAGHQLSTSKRPWELRIYDTASIRALANCRI